MENANNTIPFARADTVLSTAPADPKQRRLALGVLIASALFFVTLAPFARVPLAKVPAFLPFYEAALSINDAITALLLIGQARVARSRALFLLACAYVFTTAITIAHILTYPGVFAPGGVLGGGTQTTAWMYMFWHAGFPLAVIAYAIMRGRPASPMPMSSAEVWRGVAIALAVAMMLTLLATQGHELLPLLITNDRYAGAYHWVSTTTWLLAAVAALLLWKLRRNSVLDSWLVVVMCAWVFDVALSAVLNGGRYDLGFYAGRAYGLLAASFVLMVLLLEHSVLHARLLQARAGERDKSEQLIHAAAEMAARREHESAQNLLDAVVRQMPGGVMIAGPDGRVIFTNDQADRILGASMVENPGWTRALAPSHYPGGSPLAPEDFPLRRALRGESVHDHEIEITAPAGERRVLATSAAPVQDVDGKLIGAVSAFTDVTARKQSEQERLLLLDREQAARAEAEVANRAKDEFLAMLGHELRNPLAPIRTALQLMRMRGETAMMRERVIIERQVEHLVQLVDDLLDVSRITSGKVELRRRPCDVADILARAIEMASPLIEQRQHHLEVSGGRGLVIDCDPVRLGQVVSNLLINAAKYTPPRGRLSLAAARESDDVVIRVRDDGNGMSSELMARIFEPFVQGRQEIARPQGGLGLGLAIVQSIVRLHHGSITARSDGPGQGSEFVIRLPYAVEGAPAKDAPAPPRAGLVDVAGEGKPRVLLVDDNLDAAEMLALALETYGIPVELAADGPEALRKAQQRRYDVALLDLGLPVMDGFELASRLRALPGMEGVRLVAITGYGEERDRERSAQAGFHAHLVKPVDIEKVAALVRDTVPARASG